MRRPLAKLLSVPCKRESDDEAGGADHREQGRQVHLER